MKTATPPTRIPVRTTAETVTRRRYVSAWCLGCNRRLPPQRSGRCTHCLRSFDRTDRSTHRKAPLVETGPSVAEQGLWVAVAVLVYSSNWWLDHWISRLIWMSSEEWAIGTMLIVWLRTVVTVACLLYAAVLRGYDRFFLIWFSGGLLGAVLAAPFGALYLLVGLISGMAAALWAYWVSQGGCTGRVVLTS